MNTSSSIMAFNLGHDGAVVLLTDMSLDFSLEREKDSFPRHSSVSADLILEGIQRAGRIPDTFAIGGWSVGDGNQGTSHGYHGIDDHLAHFTNLELFGLHLRLFQSTHERSHIFCTYGMSALPQGTPCYVLVWEGEIGSFYEVDERLRISRLESVINAPGYKYSFAYDLAHAAYNCGSYRLDSAGKLMALASFSSHGECTTVEERAIKQILYDVRPPITDKNSFGWSPYLNCGVTDPAFVEFAGKFSDALFGAYLEFATKHMTKQYPLLIAGGCGLNCDWNTKWRDSGLFEEVFVPPVTNDAGSAIGTAIEAQYKLTGNAKIQWNVYSGLEFDWDQQADGLIESEANLREVAQMLARGNVIAWVSGRYEIGPRALGHRSLLASPFERSTRDRLNRIKYREAFRPVAPVCLIEDVAEHFGDSRSSPYMLYIYNTKSTCLQAVTHVDGSARVQTISATEDPSLYELLRCFKEQTGYGVLCNTSLNFHGKGFINRTSELLRFVHSRRIDAAVVNDKMYRAAI